jgi:hypothetical protein
VPDRVILNGAEYLEAVLLVKISGLKIEGIEMNVIATILNGELLGPREKLLSDSFPRTASATQRALMKNPFQSVWPKRPAIVASDSSETKIPNSLNLASPALDSLNSTKPLKIRSLSCEDGSQRTSILRLFMAELIMTQ